MKTVTDLESARPHIPSVFFAPILSERTEKEKRFVILFCGVFLFLFLSGIKIEKIEALGLVASIDGTKDLRWIAAAGALYFGFSYTLKAVWELRLRFSRIQKEAISVIALKESMLRELEALNEKPLTRENLRQQLEVNSQFEMLRDKFNPGPVIGAAMIVESAIIPAFLSIATALVSLIYR